jgi:hypothetical protein
MLQIDDKVVSLDLLERHFVCDLSACLGACCVQGDGGAPLEYGEAELLDEYLDKIKPCMTPAGIEVVARCGVADFAPDGTLETPLNGNREECAYSYFTPDGVCMCAIEKAWRAGDIPFNKPVSCHLYPIRLKAIGDLTALNFDRWHICDAALSLGEREGQPVFRFLKEPIIRKFGSEFYDALEVAYNELCCKC